MQNDNSRIFVLSTITLNISSLILEKQTHSTSELNEAVKVRGTRDQVVTSWIRCNGGRTPVVRSTTRCVVAAGSFVTLRHSQSNIDKLLSPCFMKFVVELVICGA